MEFSPMRLVIASHNVHKIREFREMLKSFKQLDILSLLDFPNYHLPNEIGSTFQENAILKSEHAARNLKEWVIADDSGLVVPALNGEPGVLSRRYASDDATDVENRQKLLDKMQNLKGEQRAAYFECSLALSSPQGLEKCVSGTSEGVIQTKEKGSNGFGYDSLFLKNEYNKTFGEIDEATKNRISHRRKAFEKLTSVLENLNS